jgi:hypothetical protein
MAALAALTGAGPRLQDRPWHRACILNAPTYRSAAILHMVGGQAGAEPHADGVLTYPNLIVAAAFLLVSLLAFGLSKQALRNL